MTRWRFKLLLLVLIGIVITVFFIQPLHGSRITANYKKTVLTVGYLTAIHGEVKEKQGLAVSGAITLALDEVRANKRTYFLHKHYYYHYYSNRMNYVYGTIHVMYVYFVFFFFVCILG